MKVSDLLKTRSGRDLITSTPGVYKIILDIDGRFYIGSGKNIRKRFNQHFNLLLNGKHPNKYLQNSWNKYGKENFSFEVIEECEDYKDREAFYIKKYNVVNKSIGFNMTENTRGGFGLLGQDNPSFGRKLSKEHIAKMLAARGNITGVNNANYGKKFSEERKRKMSEARKGKPSPNKGKTRIGIKLTEEQKKIRKEKMKIYLPAGSKLNPKIVSEIRELHQKETNLNKIAEIYSVSVSTIKDILSYRTWKNV